MTAVVRKSKAKPRPLASKPERKALLYFPQETILVVTALTAVVLACYANSLSNGFVFDDEFLIPAYSRSWNLSQLIKTLFDSYRPVRNASYAIDFLIWGTRPFGFHLTNVLIHAVNSLLVYFLVRRIATKRLIAFVAALIFAVHPIQTDAVSYVSGRRDILFTLFYLSSFHAYLKYRAEGSWRFFVLFLGFWALSLMSKEMAVSLPLIIFIWNFCSTWSEASGSLPVRAVQATKRALAKDKWLYAMLAIVSVAFGIYVVFIRQASGRIGGGNLEYWGGSLYATVLTVLRVHAWYLKQLVYPTPIAQYFGAFDISSSLLDARVIFALLLVVGVIVVGAICLNREKLIAFAVFSYFAALLPVSQIIPHHELLADHYLYLPMVSFGLLVGVVADLVARRGKSSRQIAYGVVGVAIVIFGIQTVARNRDWKNELSVWEANYSSLPNSPRASYNLGGLYMVKDPQRSERLLKESIANDPTFEPAYLTLAKLYVTQKRTDEAKTLIRQGLDLVDSPNKSFIIRNTLLLKSQFTTTLAAAKWEEGDHQGTEQSLRQAMAIYPRNLTAYDSLANLYHNQDRGKEEDTLKEALAANPSAYEVRARLAALIMEEKRYDEVSRLLSEMLELGPTQTSCDKARGYITEVRSKASRSMELKSLSDMAESIMRECER
jgi:protein O-mannosyl-transferase